jgi:flagellar protein FlaG
VASASVETMILFIAGIVVAVGVAGALTGQVQDLSGAIDDTGLDVAEEVRTDVEVISDPGSQVYNASGAQNLTLYVKNTGSASLDADGSEVDLLLDGQYESDLSVTVLDGPSWGPTNVARLNVSVGALPADDHRAKVIVNGDEEVFRFRT